MPGRPARKRKTGPRPNSSRLSWFKILVAGLALSAKAIASEFPIHKPVHPDIMPTGSGGVSPFQHGCESVDSQLECQSLPAAVKVSVNACATPAFSRHDPPTFENFQLDIRMPKGRFEYKSPPWTTSVPNPVSLASSSLETIDFVKMLQECGDLTTSARQKRMCVFEPISEAGVHGSKKMKRTTPPISSLAAVKMSYGMTALNRERAAYHVLHSLGIDQPAVAGPGDESQCAPSQSLWSFIFSMPRKCSVFSEWKSGVEQVYHLEAESDGLWRSLLSEPSFSGGKKEKADFKNRLAENTLAGGYWQKAIDTLHTGLLVDALGMNPDRHTGNIVATKDGSEVYLIDNDNMFSGIYHGALAGMIRNAPLRTIGISDSVIQKILNWDSSAHTEVLQELGIQKVTVDAFINRMRTLQGFLAHNNGREITLSHIDQLFGV